MSHTHQLKTAARLMAERTGRPYQTCLQAVTARDLSPLPVDPSDPAVLTDLLAVQLLAAGESCDLGAARRAILESTVAAVVRRHHPDAVAAVIDSDEDEPVVARLATVELAGGDEVDVFATPAGDEAWPWVNVLAAALGLPAGDCHQVRVPATA